MADETAPVRVIPRERRDRLGEGLLWSSREQAVYWVDILGQRVNRLDLATDAVASWAMPETIGWLIEREKGDFVAGLGRAFVRLALDPLAIEPLAAPEPERTANRFNDAKADGAGRIWAGSMPFAADRPTGALYRLDPDGTAERVDDGYTIANGPAIAADGRSLFHTDTAERTIYRFKLDDQGRLGPREPFILFQDGWGNPDGMTLDADGGLWVACWGAGRVTRFTSEGRPDRSILLPASQITNVTFAGDALDRMFVTSAAEDSDEPLGGALFEVEPGCRGLPTLRYAG